MGGSRVTATSDQPPASAKPIPAPRNMIPVYVNSVPARCLVDSGASHCICSGEFYRKLVKKKEGSAEKLVIRNENRELLAADNSRMPVSISFDAEIKINGLT